MAEFFAGFTEHTIALDAQRHFRLRRAGTGPALLMLHGMPQTHVIWHLIAPTLAQHFTVICPDLTGYGQSYKPPATADHAPYAKRAMARDMVDLMDHLGLPHFALVGHDRGPACRTVSPSIMRIKSKNSPCSTLSQQSNISSAPIWPSR